MSRRSDGRISTSLANIAGQNLSVGFRPLPRTAPGAFYGIKRGRIILPLEAPLRLAEALLALFSPQQVVAASTLEDVRFQGAYEFIRRRRGLLSASYCRATTLISFG